ncbi:MAG TPA: FHA domain-containing protein [Planctomycetota bacterium]|jgi:hypothetical protein
MAQAKLVGLMDPVKDKEVPCSGLLKIGRDEKTNSLPVKHASVSRQHAQLFEEAGAWVVEDLKSTNGVFVNDARIAGKVALKNGDAVRIGDINFRFELGAAAAPAEEEADLTISSSPPRPPVPTVPTTPVSKAAAVAVAPAPVIKASEPAPAPAAAKPAPEPAKPAAPKPVAAPKPAPAPAATKGGEDLFEPSIVGQDMGAALRAAQAQAQVQAQASTASPSHASKAAPPPDEPFEGTMYGPQVARQLVKAIREEKQQAEQAAQVKGGGLPAIGKPAAGPKLPNMFLLKLKAIVLAIVCLGGIAAFLVWAFIGREATQKADKTLRDVRIKVEAFVDKYEDRLLAGGDLVTPLSAELKELTELQVTAKEAAPNLAGLPDYASRMNELQSRINFLVFERKIKLAVLKGDRAAATQLIDELKATGTPSQKNLVPLATYVSDFQLFRKDFPEEPKRAEQAPPKETIAKLVAAIDGLKDQYKMIGMQIEGKRFQTMAKEVIDVDRAAVEAWDKFWKDYDAYQSATGADKTAKLADLKKSYPNLKILQSAGQ